MSIEAMKDAQLAVLVPVDALIKWRDAFAAELEAWDIDPPLHHVQTSHDEIDNMLNTPPAAQRPWVGLTPDDIRQLEKENTVGGLHGDYCPTWDLIESVEAKLKEKNT